MISFVPTRRRLPDGWIGVNTADAAQAATPRPHPRIARERYAAIAADAARHGVTEAARLHRINPQSVRNVLKRLAAAEHSTPPLAAD